MAATDGSKTGDRAVTFAAALAREHGVSLTICNVVDRTAAIASCTTPFGGIDAGELVRELDAASTEILERASAIARRLGVAPATVSLSGEPAETIVAYAAGAGAGAIVLGTQGKRGIERLVLGSTAADVLRRADVPTFVVPPGATTDHVPIERVLVALDDSGSSDAAFAYALTFAHERGATLILCCAVETRDVFDRAATGGFDPQPLLATRRRLADERLERAAARCDAHGIAHDRTAVEGSAAHAIVSTAALYRADAVIVGSHGRRGLSRVLLGSVAERVVREAAVPVAVVRSVARPRARTTVRRARASCRRWRRGEALPSGACGLGEFVSHADDGDDELGPRRFVLDLLAEICDVSIERPIVHVAVGGNAVENLFAREHAADVRGERVEHAKFGRRQVDGETALTNLMRRAIDLEASDPAHVARVARGASRLDANGARPL